MAHSEKRCTTHLSFVILKRAGQAGLKALAGSSSETPASKERFFAQCSTFCEFLLLSEFSWCW